MKQGIIALDIDGTITDERHLIPDAVALYLKELSHHWAIILITGRSFGFAGQSITKLDFPFILAVQNGADILLMPEKKVLARHYIFKEQLLDLENMIDKEPEDFIVYAGYENGDFCYWRPNRLSAPMHLHYEMVAKLAPMPWVALSSYHDVKQPAFPLIKYAAEESEALRIEQLIKEQMPDLMTAVIREPLKEGLSLLLITDHQVNKGKALKNIIRELKLTDLPIIAAGDDTNDIPMLEQADIKIVMETAPAYMHRHADILAKPSTECGIIAALKEAIAQRGEL